MTDEGKARERGPYASNLHITRAKMDQAGETVAEEDQDPEEILWRHSTAHNLMLGASPKKKGQYEGKNRG